MKRLCIAALLLMFAASMSACTAQSRKYDNLEGGEVVYDVPVCKEGQTKDCVQPINKASDCDAVKDEASRELCKKFAN